MAVAAASPFAAEEAHAKGEPGASVRTLVNHADTMYWFAMRGRGSLPAIRSGYAFLDEAETSLEQAREILASGATERAATIALGDASRLGEPGFDLAAELDVLEREIAALRDSDLKYRRHQIEDTHFGVFPLARFIGPTLFGDPRATGVFELLDDPDDVAARDGIGDLCTHLEMQTAVPQYDVFCVSKPRNHDLENEAAYWFFHADRFSMRNRRELAMVLTPEQQEEVYALDPSPETLDALLDYCQTPQLLLVRVTKIDEVRNQNHAFVAEGRAYDGVTRVSGKTYKNGGFCIDRRAMLLPIIALHLAAALAAVMLYRLLVKHTSLVRQWPSWGNSLLVGGLGFVGGRLIVWVLAPLLRGIEPTAETLAWWSFWWPAAAGAAFVLGPAVVVHFAQRRLGGLGGTLTFNRGGAFLATVALGSGVYMAQTALLFSGAAAWWSVPPLLVSATACGFLVGRSLDETDAVPLAVGISAAACTLLLGLAWCHGDAAYLWLVSLPVVGLTAYAIWPEESRRGRVARSVPVRSEVADPAVQTCEGLIQLAYDPPFRQTVSLRNVDEALEPWRRGETVRVAVVGHAGSGKTASVREIERTVLEATPTPIVLLGHCSEPQDGATPEPFEPFTEAIAEHFAVNLLAPPANQMKHIDDALGGIFDTVVPFSDILFPPAQQGVSGSRKEIFIAVASMLRRLASRHPLLLILDDVHWMDPASCELLAFLLDEFPEGGPCQVTILTASREGPEALCPGHSMRTIKIEPPSEDELLAMLVEGLKLHRDAAADVVEAVGDQRENLFCLFQIIITAARKELFTWRDGCFQWRESIDLSEHAPDDYRRSLEALIEEHPEYRPLLECAACEGTEFNVESLSHGLGIPRLEVIHLLDQIEKITGVISDVRSKDEVFAFRSTFQLEVLRKILEVSARGPQDATTAQRYREYHFRIATALERTMDQSPAMIYRTANHYFAAGARHADKALEFSLQAAHAASAQYQHDLARKYVAMARECLVATGGLSDELERELFFIECREAHVEGRGRVEMAERGRAFLQSRPDADFEVFQAVALACYDAGVDTRDQRHFQDCVEVAGTMLDRFAAPLEQAEGHQFTGIALPLSEKERRLEHLTTALSLVEKCEVRDPGALRLESRIANSLAEQLSYGSPEDRSRARELFELSIGLKSREDIRDLEGLAVAHGGFGRLAFFADPPDYATAREHFAEDLRYSEKIGSRTGQTKMHSLLAACDLAGGTTDGSDRHASALGHYEAAYEAAEEQFDAFFALAGLIECHEALGQHDRASERGDLLVELVRTRLAALPEMQLADDPLAAIPAPCRDGIRKALDACDACRDAAWRRWLREMLDHNRVMAPDAAAREAASGAEAGS